MKLIVGLGNPGKEYGDTYHNVGFWVVNKLASRLQAPGFSFDKKSNSELSAFFAFGQKVVLCMPQTYMNLSGDAVSYIARYFKLEPEDILVIYDDIDIPKGTVRARTSGSAGTHNGMRDIVAKLGSTDFARVRVGTGFKPSYMALADYVLSHIPSGEKPLMESAYAAAADFAEEWISGKPWQDLTVIVNA